MKGFLLFAFTLLCIHLPHPVWAQSESDDSYDPFADYSEFDEASEEEADINFFRNGRFFTLGFAGGMRGYTSSLGSLYENAPTYGVYLSYFFDLRLAIQFGFLTGDSPFKLNVNDPNKNLDGNVSLTMLNADLKYYFNTQNVTRGLADLNPYLLGGFSQIYRTLTLSDNPGFGRDATIGVDLGAGLEIPMWRRKAYFGIQGTYRYFSFKDENSFLLGKDGAPTTVKPQGDSFDILAILGLNF
ncbi:MAG: porin family protein [Proteobacteria bacterium]|jgi:hypothetical protein|nr:porin family protein [Pseudomonadota bacterium]